MSLSDVPFLSVRHALQMHYEAKQAPLLRASRSIRQFLHTHKLIIVSVDVCRLRTELYLLARFISMYFLAYARAVTYIR